MNHSDGQWPKDNDSEEQKQRDLLRRQKRRPFLFLAGTAVILLAGFVFYQHRESPMSLLAGFKAGSKVFRTKIPQETKIAKNIYRAKIPAVDLPVNPAKENERTPPVEKVAVPTQPAEAPLVKRELQQEKTVIVAPPESQVRIETRPPVADAVPFESNFEPPKKIEPLAETALVESVDPLAKIETMSPEEDAGPSQPVEEPTELSDVGPDSEPQLPATTQIKIETVQPELEQPAFSQSTVVSSEQGEQPEKSDLRRAAIPSLPVKKDAAQKAGERIIHNEKWLLSLESSNYTIQLMGARKEALLSDFVERNQLLKQNEVAYYQTTFKDKPWFQLLYGVYATKKDAQSAAENLPPKIRESTPWIRRLSAVQKTIRKRAAQ